MRRTDGSRGPLSDQPTEAGPDPVGSTSDRPAASDAAVRRYETALGELGPRDRRALRGRFEQQLPFDRLADSISAPSAQAARAVVIRALARLVAGMSGVRCDADLTGLFASVADGWPQDWSALDARARDEAVRGALRSLRTVTESAVLHRCLPAPASARRGSASVTPGRPSARQEPGRPRSALGQWDRFVLLKRLGEGSYGEVYHAYDTQLDRDVALKLLKPDHSGDPGQRLFEEARMLARVRHPNVASLYGAAEHGGRPGLWMELIRGVNLEEMLRAGGPMSGCEAALVGLDVCRALAAVHAAGLVHRDVKASNVMRETGGRIVLTDFGAGSGPGGRRGFAGTPLYVAPEVLAGSEASVRSDVYSLGVVLFRMVTGCYPRRVLDVETTLAAGVPTVPTSLRDLRPDLPEAFVAALEQALASNPADRQQTAGAFRAALGLVLGVPASWGGARRHPAATPHRRASSEPTSSCLPPA